MNFNHISVLMEEATKGLNIKPDGIYVDGTLGGGGHSYKICEKLLTGRLIGIDQDINAIQKAKAVLKPFEDKVTFIHDNFKNIKDILCFLNISRVDGFLLDLGVSSHQLDESSRGFSYNQDAALDMRMDTTQKFSAYSVVNEYSVKELNRVIYQYGEERWSKRIAEFIVKERAVNPIKTTYDLVSVIKKAIPKSAREDGPHPAKRTFQAIRIEVNNELGILEDSISTMVGFLNKTGRICVITFHSLEDRIIKNAFKNLEKPCKCPPEFPVCVCGKKPKLKIITKKPISSDSEELLLNHRARSAKLRIAEKI